MRMLILKLWKQFWFPFLTVFIALGISLNSYIVIQFTNKQLPVPYQQTGSHAEKTSKTVSSASIPVKQVKPLAKNQLNENAQNPLASKPLLGHFPYKEGNFGQMLILGSYGSGDYQRFERLMPEAAFALMKLTSAARDEGVWIIPVSCFRNLQDQRKLFTDQIRRRGSREAAAKSSAPPGYSEHHTGYALDLADGHFPQQDVSLEFAKTEAFKWMDLRAKEFGFELSFPESNPQGINYEPWHWRFIGTPESSRIFNHLP